MLVLRVIVLLGVSALVGCQGSPFLNPFGVAGPTQVPPPPTGCARRPDPYYRSSLNQPTRLSQRTFNSEQDRLPERAVASRQAPIDDGASYNQNSPSEYQQPHEDDRLDWRSPPSSFEVPAVGTRPRVRLPLSQGYSQASPARIDQYVQPANVEVPIPQPSGIRPTSVAPRTAAQPNTFGGGYNGWTSTQR